MLSLVVSGLASALLVFLRDVMTDSAASGGAEECVVAGVVTDYRARDCTLEAASGLSARGHCGESGSGNSYSEYGFQLDLLHGETTSRVMPKDGRE